jgi:hypothetical protein
MEDRGVRELLLEIAHCPILKSILDDPAPTHPCSRVALTQWEASSTEDRLWRWREVHQVPEPWVGHVREARLLFVSSNPSISGSVSPDPGDPPPGLRWNDPDPAIVERYEEAFDKFIVDGIQLAAQEGRRASGSRCVAVPAS